MGRKNNDDDARNWNTGDMRKDREAIEAANEPEYILEFTETLDKRKMPAGRLTAYADMARKQGLMMESEVKGNEVTVRLVSKNPKYKGGKAGRGKTGKKK